MYKYAGDKIWKELAWGPEEVAVGNSRETSAGGKGSRIRRRERRGSAQEAMYGFMPPFCPYGPPSMAFPAFSPGFGPPPIAPPTFAPPVPPVRPLVPEPTPLGAVAKASGAAAADESAEPAKAWGKREWGKEWPKNEWAKRPKWSGKDEQKKGWTNEDNSKGIKAGEESAQREKTARLLGVCVELRKLGKSSKEPLFWCLKCRLKAYCGNEMCITPGCQWPTALLSMLPADGPTNMPLVQA